MGDSTGEIFDNLKSRPGLDPLLLDKLRAWIADAPEPDLYRINLAALAPRWNIPLKTAITHFLHLSKAGAVDLSWDMHCPQCNVVLDRQESLRLAGPIHFCKYCLKDVESKLDDHFEVTFTPSPRLRQVRGYVRYEPSANVEVYLKEKVARAGSVSPEVAIPAVAMRLRVVTWPPVQVVVIPAGPIHADPVIRFEGDDGVRLPNSLPAGTFRLILKNDTAADKNVMIENHDMREYEPHERAARLTGFQVVSTPAFRELFGGETLSDRESLKIRDATIVFTDIQGSTALYRDAGDVRAYTLVRDHFDTLFDSVIQHDGIVIKTIGDSVMASFQTPDQAVRGMLDAQSRFAQLARSGAQGVRIRVGIHRGPVIAVTLNDRLDYFGTTVNESARIEGTCGAGEIVLSDDVLNAPGVRDLLAACAVEPFEADLKGLARYRLHRAQAGRLGV